MKLKKNSNTPLLDLNLNNIDDDSSSLLIVNREPNDE